MKNRRPYFLAVRQDNDVLFLMYLEVPYLSIELLGVNTVTNRGLAFPEAEAFGNLDFEHAVSFVRKRFPEQSVEIAINLLMQQA